MTKEELEKEAEDYYNNVTVGTFQECIENFADAVLTAYKDSAEPREKRIEELEAENEQIKNSDTLCKLIGEQKRKITEHEKENAELKERDCWKSCEYANTKAELIGQPIKDVQNLTKAKEIIANILTYFPNYKVKTFDDMSLLNALVKAEQFLKE